MKQAFQIIVITFVFIICIFIYEYQIKSSPLGDHFELVDSNGKKITLDDIRKKPAVIYFGYTMCPDVCPTTLYDLEQALNNVLGSQAEKIGIWFFTVDPERDTPEIMRDYLSNFSNKITGISGEPNKVHAAIKSFKVIAKKVMTGNGDYTYDHTALTILLDKGGKVIDKIPYRKDSKIILDRLKNFVKQVEKQ